MASNRHNNGAARLAGLAVLALALVGAALAALVLAALAARVQAASASTPHAVSHAAPAWQGMLPASVRQPCRTAYAVNCYRAAGAGSYVVRQLPGRRHLVCVLYVAPAAAALDYCA